MDSKPAADKKPEDEKKDWAEMSDDDAENDTAGANEESQAKSEPEPKKIIPPTQKGTKNKQGDYIVEKFEIPDFRDGMKKQKDDSEEEEESSDDYGNEDDNADSKVEEAKPKEEGKSPFLEYSTEIVFNTLLAIPVADYLIILNDLQIH